MKISKELILGAVAIATVGIMIWGYNFLKGQDLFSESMTLHSTYDDVYQLAVSSPVYINGLKVGSVSHIDINRENVKEMRVSYFIDGDYGIPKDARAVMISEGLVGGKALALKFDHVCKGDCAQDGDHLESGKESLLASMAPKEEVNEYIEAVKSAITSSLGGENGEASGMMTNLDATMSNMATLTASLDRTMARSSKSLSNTFANLDQITQNLAANNARINTMLANLESITTDLKAAKMSGVVDKANLAMDDTRATIQQLKNVLDNGDKTVGRLNALLSKIENGEGSLGSLVNDPNLYKNLEATSRNMSLLLQDLRLNPKRYVSLSIFGGKNDKEYVKPENDPAGK